jgi:hypothetical protein
MIGMLALGMSGAASADEFGIGNHPGQPWHGPQVRTAVFTCSSYFGTSSQCEVEGRILNAYVQQDYSGHCQPGYTFGWSDNTLFVSNGCSASFVVTYDPFAHTGPQPWPNPNPNPQPWPQPGPHLRTVKVTCESIGKNFRECGVNLNYIQDVSVAKQLSNSKCIEGHSYGISGDRIWVDRGCRAKFRVTGY